MENNIYNLSLVKAIDELPEVPDNVLIHNAMGGETDTQAMAAYLVFGADENGDVHFNEDATKEEIATYYVLMFVLPLVQALRLRDIHRLLEIPDYMLRRWHDAFDIASDVCFPTWGDEQEETPTITELEEMWKI